MSHPTVNMRTAATVLREAFDKVVDTQQDQVAAAAALVVERRFALASMVGRYRALYAELLTGGGADAGSATAQNC